MILRYKVCAVNRLTTIKLPDTLFTRRSENDYIELSTMLC